MKKYLVAILALVAFMLFVALKSEKKQFTIYSIGDSTMATKEDKKYPETGWGQMLPTFFNSEILFQNHAANGRSSKSFIGEGRWQKVYEQLRQGDYVLIQFGHNDQKDKSPDRFTNPYTGFRGNLYFYIDQCREKGAIPVLLTSIVRRNFNADSVLIDTHGAYTEVVRTVAKEKNVELIDLQMYTEKLVLDLGYEKSTSLYLHLKEGDHENYPKGVADNTHLCREGAKIIARQAVNELSAKFPNIKLHRIEK
jgi:lysophospholipase L1-like esterase